MSLTERQALQALSQVRYPGFSRDVVSFGTVQDLRVDEGRVSLRLEIGPGNPAVVAEIERDVRAALLRAGASSVEFRAPGPAPSPGLPMIGAPRPPAARPVVDDEGILPGVRHVIAVASGKGGVGKSTVAVNLAVALAQCGWTVGLLDADIYGPSIPLMMGTDEKPSLDEGGAGLIPFERFGVRFMSLGFLVDKEAAVIWRGPMVMKAVSQLLSDVRWGLLDVLVIDMPPGTGDAQLTISQKVQLAGAVIVTTPQDVALADAIKGVAMFQKVGVPVLGIVENMSYFACPHCGERTEIFGHGGGRKEAKRLGVPFLGEIALDSAVRDSGDRGRPIASSAEGTAPAEAFAELARKVQRALAAGDGDGDGAEGGGGFLSRLRKGWTS